MTEAELVEIEALWKGSCGVDAYYAAPVEGGISGLIAEVRRLKFLLKDAQDGIEITSDLSWNAAIEAAALSCHLNMQQEHIRKLKRPAAGGSDD